MDGSRELMIQELMIPVVMISYPFLLKEKGFEVPHHRPAIVLSYSCGSSSCYGRSLLTGSLSRCATHHPLPLPKMAVGGETSAIKYYLPCILDEKK